jgi:hypothetical protein
MYTRIRHCGSAELVEQAGVCDDLPAGDEVDGSGQLADVRGQLV